MEKNAFMCLLLFTSFVAVAQLTSALAHTLIEGRLLKGKWQYSSAQQADKVIVFKEKSITIKDSLGTQKFKILNDVVTKRLEKDSCITYMRTGYDGNNIRCIVNLVEFFNGVNVLNVLYKNRSYSYYFKYNPN